MLGLSLFPFLLWGCERPTPIFTAEVDGVIFHQIPADDYLLGSPEGEGQQDESPQLKVEAKSFWIMTTEVTNAQFSDFLNSSEDSVDEIGQFIGINGYCERPSEIKFTGKRYRPSYGYEDHPVMTVSFRGAEIFCQAINARLPTEMEWEIAARGGLLDAKFPWGDDPPEGRALFGQEWDLFQPIAPTQPVGQYAPNGYGLYDMAGSVWEWTQTLYYNYETQEASEDARVRAVVRGGSWGSPEDELRVAFRRNYEINIRSNFSGGLGFRCVRDIIVP
ncbi:MAG: SUMF1/EgtB/PvdO family nonheme iron enzyme [Myxococcota bacterium]|nr:SUMF1/EgtB/PvdO family nonheme iron enzyme [Myxococcota bacterium]